MLSPDGLAMPRSADKSIEHITPQSSEEKYIHNLGNLTMLPPGVNSSLKDKPPKEKAAIYKQCGLRGTMAVANSIEVSPWDEKAVLRRTTAYPGTAPRMSRQGRQPRPLRHLPMAEVSVSRQMFGDILSLIAQLRAPPAPA
jgi:hypothetical protein